MPRAGISVVHKPLGGSVLTPSAAICLVIRREGSVLKARDGIRVVLGLWGVSLTRPVLVCHGLVESFTYTLRHGISVFVRPCRSVGGEFLLHAPC